MAHNPEGSFAFIGSFAVPLLVTVAIIVCYARVAVEAQRRSVRTALGMYSFGLGASVLLGTVVFLISRNGNNPDLNPVAAWLGRIIAPGAIISIPASAIAGVNGRMAKSELGTTARWIIGVAAGIVGVVIGLMISMDVGGSLFNEYL